MKRLNRLHYDPWDFTKYGATRSSTSLLIEESSRTLRAYNHEVIILASGTSVHKARVFDPESSIGQTSVDVSACSKGRR